MSKKLRRYLQVMSPLFAVQLFLVGLNVVLILNGATRVFWAIYPVLGMMIPQMIVGSFMFLREDDEERARQLMPQAVKVPKSGMQTAALPAQIDSTLVAEIERVRVYKGELERMARLSGNTLQAARLADLARQYEGWLGDVQQQAERITAFKLNAGIQADVRNTQASIVKLEKQLPEERDARVKATLEATLASRRTQLESLNKLFSTMRHADAQFESTVASLGTVYAQALAGQGTNNIANYSHLANEVDERVHSLNDQLAALEEVRLGQKAQNTAG